MGKNTQGFTLIELLVVMSITGILAAGVVGFQFILTQNQMLVFKNYSYIDKSNIEFSRIVRELRIARYSENGAYPLETLEDFEISFYSDYDFDQEVEHIRYFVNNNTLTKGIIEPQGSPTTYPLSQEQLITISTDIRNNDAPVFYYYNENWPQDIANNPLSTPASPTISKLIKIYLRVNTVADNPENDYIFETQVQNRTLKENI